MDLSKNLDRQRRPQLSEILIDREPWVTYQRKNRSSGQNVVRVPNQKWTSSKALIIRSNYEKLISNVQLIFQPKGCGVKPFCQKWHSLLNGGKCKNEAQLVDQLSLHCQFALDFYYFFPLQVTNAQIIQRVTSRVEYRNPE